MARTYPSDDYAVETDSPPDNRLANIGGNIKGAAQTAERLTDNVDGFLRRCGILTNVTSGEASNAKPPISGHFQNIDDNLARLESAIKALDQRVTRLNEIG